MIEKGSIATTHGSAIGVNGNESEYLMAGAQYGVVVSGQPQFSMNGRKKPINQINAVYGGGVAAAAININ